MHKEKIETIKDRGNWYAMKRVKDDEEPTGIYQWVREGKTKKEAIAKLKRLLKIIKKEKIN